MHLLIIFKRIWRLDTTYEIPAVSFSNSCYQYDNIQGPLKLQTSEVFLLFQEAKIKKIINFRAAHMQEQQLCQGSIYVGLPIYAGAAGKMTSYTNIISFVHKVEKILKGSLDSILSPPPSVKIQIMGRKVCLRCKGKTLLGDINIFLFSKLC